MATEFKCAVCGTQLADNLYGTVTGTSIRLSGDHPEIKRAKSVFGDVKQIGICTVCYLKGLGVPTLADKEAKTSIQDVEKTECDKKKETKKTEESGDGESFLQE